jgi:hypothetical protein
MILRLRMYNHIRKKTKTVQHYFCSINIDNGFVKNDLK